MKKIICMYNENKFGMNYEIFHPENFEDLPLLIYLHGAGERGKNIENLSRHGVAKLLSEGKEIPAVVLCPQCPEWCVWDNIVSDVKALIDEVAERFEIKKDRICITGSSMGGFGTWMMGLTYNNFFSGIAPVSGGGMSWRTPNLKTTPVLATHGTDDDLVPITYSELMTDAVNKAGGNARLIKLSGQGHNDAINYAYEHTEVIEWLLSQRRTNFEKTPEFCSEWF